jgi:hypothetical protein
MTKSGIVERGLWKPCGKIWSSLFSGAPEGAPERISTGYLANNRQRFKELVEFPPIHRPYGYDCYPLNGCKE